MEEVEDEGERDDGEGLGNALPAARVKRIMRKNPDKKKNFSKDTVLAVSMATELFLDDIVKRSHEHTVTKKRKTMQLADIESVIKVEPRYEFMDGPGILPVLPDKKTKTEKPEMKESESKDAAQVPSMHQPSNDQPSDEQQSAGAAEGAATASATTTDNLAQDKNQDMTNDSTTAQPAEEIESEEKEPESKSASISTDEAVAPQPV